MAVIALNPVPVPVIIEKAYPSDKIKVYRAPLSALSTDWFNPPTPAPGDINGYGYAQSG